MSDIEKGNNSSIDTIADMLKLKKKLRTHAVILMTLGIVGVVCVLVALVWYIVAQSMNHIGIRFGVMMYYVISILVLSAMISAGAYMNKTAHMIDVGVKSKIKEIEENIDDQKE